MTPPRDAVRNGTLFDGENLGPAMKTVDWIRASQAVLFEASIVPAFVGTAAAISSGASFDPARFALILISLVGIQAGANLFKGFYEGRDRSAPLSSPGSWVAFDSAAATNLTENPRTVLLAGYACFAVGAFAGLLLVVLTASLLLLAFGLAGAFLAWSYSSPPLRFSYRGVGEIATFLAFGPIMTVGATVAFGGAGLVPSLLASVVLGFLAAAISFARYFPNRDEDRSKGKRTPVIILGVHRARMVLVGILAASVAVGIAWIPFRGGIVWVVVLAAFVLSLARSFPNGAEPSEEYELPISLTIAAHVFTGLGLLLYFRLSL